ncbi:PLP-dependent transferase [Periconia macrospinosa]|uniref:PLP-dependent transferase n=1 Tax=Periconia macrospinosa TaxID=97972 RepID=A0A2V1DF95_9PLEO|nr:PLP-dependent transferase [Periconia macrospinosa]
MVALNFSEVVGSPSSSQKLINLLRGHTAPLPATHVLRFNTYPFVSWLTSSSRRWPNTSLLPTSILEKASQRVFHSAAINPALLYGPDDGDEKLRVQLASWFTTFFPHCSSVKDRICITGGASQNLACLLQSFTDPLYTRNVFIVSPAYMLAFRIFQDSALSLRAVPEDDEGIDVDFLQQELKKSDKTAGNNDSCLKPDRPWGKVYRHVIYAVPAFSNPSSKTMTLKRREELVRLAREHNALIIADDVYDFLQWPASLTAESLSLDKAILPRLVDIDRYLDGGTEREGADGFGNAASNGSFSKIAAPGIRTGWCEGTAKFAYGVSQTGSTRSGGAPSQLAATFLAEALESGELQRHVYETLQPSYGIRYQRMVTAINEELIPLGVRLPQTDRDVVGGYFIWITLPDPLKGAVVAQRCRDEENLAVAQGEIFEVPGDTDRKGTHFENALRVCFAWEEEDMLAEGIRRLARVIRKIQAEQNGSEKNPEATSTATATEETAKDFW